MNVDEEITVTAEMLGYAEVKDEQREVVRTIVGGNDVLVALPTGYRKSLCYAMLPTVFNIWKTRPQGTSIVLCVSPLISLMQKQKQKEKYIPLA